MVFANVTVFLQRSNIKAGKNKNANMAAFLIAAANNENHRPTAHKKISEVN